MKLSVLLVATFAAFGFANIFSNHFDGFLRYIQQRIETVTHELNETAYDVADVVQDVIHKANDKLHEHGSVLLQALDSFDDIPPCNGNEVIEVGAPGRSHVWVSKPDPEYTCENLRALSVYEECRPEFARWNTCVQMKKPLGCLDESVTAFACIQYCILKPDTCSPRYFKQDEQPISIAELGGVSNMCDSKWADYRNDVVYDHGKHSMLTFCERTTEMCEGFYNYIFLLRRMEQHSVISPHGNVDEW